MADRSIVARYTSNSGVGTFVPNATAKRTNARVRAAGRRSGIAGGYALRAIFVARPQGHGGSADQDEEDRTDPERHVMNAQELLRYTFPWELAPGIPAADDEMTAEVAASPSPARHAA